MRACSFGVRVWVHACVSICVTVRERVSVSACVRVCKRACVYASVRACVQAGVRVCKRACVYASVRACMQACVRACVCLDGSIAPTCIAQHDNTTSAPTTVPLSACQCAGAGRSPSARPPAPCGVAAGGFGGLRPAAGDRRCLLLLYLSQVVSLLKAKWYLSQVVSLFKAKWYLS